MQANINNCGINKFRDAENLWFWFISSARMRQGFRRAACGSFRPCELVDVETLVTRLYLSGQLTAEQLEIMKRYGERRRAPSQHTWTENAAAALWDSAMRTLAAAAADKGWIE